MRAAVSPFAIVFAAALHSAVQARAEPHAPLPALEWSGPGSEHGCLGGPGLARAVDDYLGRPSFASNSSSATVSVEVERREAFGFRALVRLRGGSGSVLGERELVSETAACSSLDEPLTLAVALMVDSELSPEMEAAAPEKTPDSKRPEGVPYVAHTRVDAAFIGVAKALPRSTAGIDLGVERGLAPWFSVRAHAAVLVPRARSDESAEARFGLVYAGLLACPGLLLGALELGPCLGLEGGLLRATTTGLETDEAFTSWFWGGSASGRLRYELNRKLSVGLGAGVVLPYRRDRFLYRDASSTQRLLFRTAAVIPFATAGLGLEL